MQRVPTRGRSPRSSRTWPPAAPRPTTRCCAKPTRSRRSASSSWPATAALPVPTTPTRFVPRSVNSRVTVPRARTTPCSASARRRRPTSPSATTGSTTTTRASPTTRRTKTPAGSPTMSLRRSSVAKSTRSNSSTPSSSRWAPSACRSAVSCRLRTPPSWPSPAVAMRSPPPASSSSRRPTRCSKRCFLATSRPASSVRCSIARPQSTPTASGR